MTILAGLLFARRGPYYYALLRIFAFFLFVFPIRLFVSANQPAPLRDVCVCVYAALINALINTRVPVVYIRRTIYTVVLLHARRFAILLRLRSGILSPCTLGGPCKSEMSRPRLMHSPPPRSLFVHRTTRTPSGDTWQREPSSRRSER